MLIALDDMLVELEDEAVACSTVEGNVNVATAHRNLRKARECIREGLAAETQAAAERHLAVAEWQPVFGVPV